MSEHLGISTLIRMGFLRVGYTCITRRNMGQIQRQIDHIFSDVELIDARKLIEPGQGIGSDHACISASVRAITKRQYNTIPSKAIRREMLRKVD
jgi:hypothetical protein